MELHQAVQLKRLHSALFALGFLVMTILQLADYMKRGW